MSQKEQEAEDKFLDKNLAKGYIVPSELPYGFSTFMVPKKDSDENDTLLIINPSMLSLGKMSHHYLTSPNA